MMTPDEIAETAEDIYEAVRLARQGMIPEPFSREVWGVRVGTWPPTIYQSREIAEHYVSQPGYGVVGGKEYPVSLVRRTEYTAEWETVGEQNA